jgi:hypothetical protein
MRRARIARLESVLAPTPRRILGATIDTRTGKLRNILASDGVSGPAPSELAIEDLPAGCFIHRYNPSQECVSLYRSTLDGRCHVQRVLNVDEEILLGFAPSWDAPLSEWPAIFAQKHIRDETAGRRNGNDEASTLRQP